MPVKRRLSKRRLGDTAEAEAWSELFQCGDDFFGDLEPLGFHSTRDGGRAARSAAAEAWDRLGAFYMQNIWPHQDQSVRKKPWALEKFGYPK
jgi:hypothetical protein